VAVMRNAALEANLTSVLRFRLVCRTIRLKARTCQSTTTAEQQPPCKFISLRRRWSCVQVGRRAARQPLTLSAGPADRWLPDVGLL